MALFVVILFSFFDFDFYFYLFYFYCNYSARFLSPAWAAHCFLEHSPQWTITFYSLFDCLPLNSCHLTVFSADSFLCCTVSLCGIRYLLLWFLFHQIMSTHANSIYAVFHTSLPPAACPDSCDIKLLNVLSLCRIRFLRFLFYFSHSAEQMLAIVLPFYFATPLRHRRCSNKVDIALRFFRYEHFFFVTPAPSAAAAAASLRLSFATATNFAYSNMWNFHYCRFGERLCHYCLPGWLAVCCLLSCACLHSVRPSVRAAGVSWRYSRQFSIAFVLVLHCRLIFASIATLQCHTKAFICFFVF